MNRHPIYKHLNFHRVRLADLRRGDNMGPDRAKAVPHPEARRRTVVTLLGHAEIGHDRVARHTGERTRCGHPTSSSPDDDTQGGTNLKRLHSRRDDHNSPVADQNPNVGGDASYPASTDAGKDTLMGLGTQAMAEAIARGGGFGIASRVIAEVGRDQQRVARMKKP